MKYLLWGALGWAALVVVLWNGTNIFFKRQLIRNYGPYLGMALWKEWKL